MTDDHGIRSWEMLHRTVQAPAAREYTQLGIRKMLPELDFSHWAAQQTAWL